MEHKKICFIGAGNMSQSLIAGLANSGYPSDLIWATNPSTNKLVTLKTQFGINTSQHNKDGVNHADVIVLCVKPQLMQQVCHELQDIDLSKKLIITIAAGILSQRYQDYFNQKVQLIRAMPNTPTQIGAGITGLWSANQILHNEKKFIDDLMQTGGKVVWVNNEDELNLVIALAGSAPAYFFLFIEAMIDSAKKLGMDETQARIFAEQAALGSAKMLITNPDLSASQLRENVTSKGGTTAEAIATFEQGNLRQLIDNAMNNCINRANEMAQTF